VSLLDCAAPISDTRCEEVRHNMSFILISCEEYFMSESSGAALPASKIDVINTVVSLLAVFLLSSTAHANENRLKGYFQIDGNGAASYTIPIKVPPGTAGMQPNLGVMYDSLHPNGIMGMGFMLTGMSKITRCPQSFRHDGDNFRRGVWFDNEDRFCADGMRLVVVEGKYGADRSRYRKEIDHGIVFTSFGRCGGGPCEFIAVGSDGSVTEYGVTHDSRIEIAGGVTRTGLDTDLQAGLDELLDRFRDRGDAGFPG
jgi:hypothetical protein